MCEYLHHGSKENKAAWGEMFKTLKPDSADQRLHTSEARCLNLFVFVCCIRSIPWATLLVKERVALPATLLGETQCLLDREAHPAVFGPEGNRVQEREREKFY